MTMDLFEKPSNSPEQIELPDAELLYWPHFFSMEDADQWYEKLLKCIDWQQKSIVMNGKSVNIPRLSAWYADENKHYTYSGEVHLAEPWTAELLDLKTQIEQTTGVRFNSVLCNLYRDGNDSVAWHSDDETELGQNPHIASLSFGEERSFSFRNKRDHQKKFNLALRHGSCLLMSGTTQQNWQHQISKSTRLMQPRINLTFRYIY